MWIYYGFDLAYLVLMLPCLILSVWASAAVSSTYKKYSRHHTLKGMSGADAAARVLAANGIHNIKIQCISGSLTDHYDPKANVIRLSQEVYHGRNVSAVGVACHEAGHAVQYKTSYLPIRLRAAVIPITGIGSKLALPLILLGFIFNLSSNMSYLFVYLGIICFALSLLLQFITLPVEFNASRRAIGCIRDYGFLTEQEQKGAKKVLRAAAMTYVAATAVSLVQIFRLLLLVNRRK